jgi:hypothetical protein
VDIGITYLSPDNKGNYHWLIHSYSQNDPQGFSYPAFVLTGFLTFVDCAVHISLFLLSTFVSLLINRDKKQVSFALSPFSIPQEPICSTSFHVSKAKNPIFPQVFGVINRGMWKGFEY